LNKEIKALTDAMNDKEDEEYYREYDSELEYEGSARPRRLLMSTNS